MKISIMSCIFNLLLFECVFKLFLACTYSNYSVNIFDIQHINPNNIYAES